MAVEIFIRKVFPGLKESWGGSESAPREEADGGIREAGGAEVRGWPYGR